MDPRPTITPAQHLANAFEDLRWRNNPPPPSRTHVIADEASRYALGIACVSWAVTVLMVLSTSYAEFYSGNKAISFSVDTIFPVSLVALVAVLILSGTEKIKEATRPVDVKKNRVRSRLYALHQLEDRVPRSDYRAKNIAQAEVIYTSFQNMRNELINLSHLAKTDYHSFMQDDLSSMYNQRQEHPRYIENGNKLLQRYYDWHHHVICKQQQKLGRIIITPERYPKPEKEVRVVIVNLQPISYSEPVTNEPGASEPATSTFLATV